MITVRHFLKPVARKTLLNPTVRQLRFRTSLLSDRTRRTIPLPFQARLESPIFIVGSSRSGSSMLTRILGSSWIFIKKYYRNLISSSMRKFEKNN